MWTTSRQQEASITKNLVIFLQILHIHLALARMIMQSKTL